LTLLYDSVTFGGMDRVFAIEDLRTLVARALAAGSYAPGDSKRVRAIPDTRTIRYYTTLGLIDRPAQMQGRLALYGQKHVLQVVAIKRLQAQGEQLGAIQKKLVGATSRKLSQIAELPADFWSEAEKYLAKPKRKAAPEKVAPPLAAAYPMASMPGPEDFWAVAPALPASVPETAPVAMAGACLRVVLEPNVELYITFPTGVTKPLDLANLQAASIPLIKELSRQQLTSLSPPGNSHRTSQDAQQP
jgi:DNA-binding transcriptional MerR regulator